MSVSVIYLPPETGVLLGAVFEQNAPNLSQQIEFFARAVERARVAQKLEAILLVPEPDPPRVRVRALAARTTAGGSAVGGSNAIAQAVHGFIDSYQSGVSPSGSSGSSVYDYLNVIPDKISLDTILVDPEDSN